MNVMVKICGLRDAADVAAAATAGANAVGFVFAKSPREVTPQEARDATRNIPAGVQRVAVMRHPSVDAYREVIEQFDPDVVQTDVEDFAELEVPEHIECWPVFRERADSDGMPPVYLYESAQSGTRETVDWRRAAEVAVHGKMILAGGLAPDNVATAMRTVRPWGVDVSSGVESRPGHKNHELIRRFVGAVRAAEKNL